jgi:hypothetical protein
MIMNATLTWTTGYEAAAYARRNENGTVAARAKHAVMLVGAPLIGLIAVIALPFVGLGVLVWMAIRALPKRVKDVALFFAAPFIGLAYAIAFPVIGVGVLMWTGVRAVAGK